MYLIKPKLKKAIIILYYKILYDLVMELYIILFIIIQNNILLNLLIELATFVYQLLLFKILIYIYL